MGLTHLDTQGENCKYRQCSVIALRAYKPIPFNNRFNPFANYRIAKGKDGQYWAEGLAPQINITNTGHFKELPEGYEFAGSIILDDSQPLHCCTVGELDPRDCTNYQLNSDDASYLTPPPFKVAIKSSDIVLHAFKTTQAHTHSIKIGDWRALKIENLFLSWCKDNGITPEYAIYDHKYTSWRAKYPNIEIDPQTLKKLNFVKIGDRYHHIQELYGTFFPLPSEHPLHDYSGLDYAQIASAYVAANAPADCRIYLQNGKYGIQEGTAEFEGRKFPFFISFGACSDGITLPFSPELLRALLKGRGEGNFTMNFTPYGKIDIRDTDACKLELPEPLMGRAAGKEVILLSKDYPNGKWKPVTRQMKAKYVNLTTYRGYKTSGEYEDRLEVYDSTQPLTPKEKRSDRITRLGLEPYKHEINVSKWSDEELLAYLDCRKQEEAGEYIQITKDDKLVQGMFPSTLPSFEGLYWVAFIQPSEQFIWADFKSFLLSAGIAKTACGKIFMRKDCIRIEDAITHCAEMVDGSHIKRFLEGILDLFQRLGVAKLQQLLLGRI